jgi:hypothetical protein
MSVTRVMSEEDKPQELCCELDVEHGHCGFCGGPCSESSQYCGSLCPGSFVARLEHLERVEAKNDAN